MYSVLEFQKIKFISFKKSRCNYRENSAVAEGGAKHQLLIGRMHCEGPKNFCPVISAVLLLWAWRYKKTGINNIGSLKNF